MDLALKDTRVLVTGQYAGRFFRICPIRLNVLQEPMVELAW